MTRALFYVPELCKKHLKGQSAEGRMNTTIMGSNVRCLARPKEVQAINKNKKRDIRIIIFSNRTAQVKHAMALCASHDKQFNFLFRWNERPF
jgi:hypothetical protein